MSDEDTAYEHYHERFIRLVGDIQPGQYGQFRGRLIRKLSPEQFTAQLSEYTKLGDQFTEAVESGATLSERLTTEIRSAEVSLVLEQSRYLP